jgi:cell division protease FtsH
MFVGLGASRVRNIFRTARKHAPAIIFIDELDAVGAKRGTDFSGERDQTLNQLLVEMDGFNVSENVVLIGASNRLESLDPALLRPGRFDRQILVGPPDLNGRKEILAVHSANKPVVGVDMGKVAKETAGLTGADLANLCNEAAIHAARAKRDRIVQTDFDEALEKVVAGLESRKVMRPEEKRTIAYHEAGHAVVAEVLHDAKGPHKITIIPHGQALGYTMHLPDEDRYLQYREEMEDHLKVLFAGRCAEELVIGRITTGASNDLNRATATSRAMVDMYAMGDSLATNVDEAPGPFGAVSKFSDNFKSSRDQEQERVLRDAKNEAMRLLVENRDLLERIAGVLLVKETLDRDGIEALIAEVEADREAAKSKAESLVSSPVSFALADGDPILATRP